MTLRAFISSLFLAPFAGLASKLVPISPAKTETAWILTTFPTTFGVGKAMWYDMVTKTWRDEGPVWNTLK